MKNMSGKKHVPSAVDDCAQVINESWQHRAGGNADIHSEGIHSDIRSEKVALLTSDREFRETRYGSEAYKTTLELRHRVLRAPLGLDLWHENLSVERDQRHFSIWQQPDTLLACVVIVPLARACVKLRQMAVNPDYQKQGLGQQLLTSVEKILLADGIGLIELHARVSAQGFYKSCGYQPVGDIFTEIGIEHLCMTKMINPEAVDR